MSDNGRDPSVCTQRRAEIETLLVECVSASLLHAVANYTNIVVGRAGMLELLRPNDAEVARAVAEIRAQMDGLSALGARAREFVASGTSSDGAASLTRELELALAELAPIAEAREVAITRAPADAAEDVEMSAAALHAICHGLVGYALCAATPGSTVSVESSPGGATLSLAVRVASAQSLPTTRRELVAPWLVGAVHDRDARLLLALALGSAQARGCRFEVKSSELGASVVVELPLRGAGAEPP